MHMKYILLKTMMIILTCTTLTACAQTRKTRSAKKKGITKPELLVAISESTVLKGNRETTPQAKFIIVWKDTATPSSFSWKGAGTWQICDINKVKNYNSKTYSYNTIPLEKEVAANDTLELIPVQGGKYPLPQEIPADAENKIFYKTDTGLWKNITVTDFERIQSNSGFTN